MKLIFILWLMYAISTCCWGFQQFICDRNERPDRNNYGERRSFSSRRVSH
jgi:hypothetical protein